MKKTIAERLLQLINSKIEPSRKFKILQEKTGIPSDRWSSFSLGRQRPTAEMFEAVGKIWPEHSFWLVTGMEDEVYGHVDHTKISPPAKDEFLLKIQEEDENDNVQGDTRDVFLQERIREAKFRRWNSVIAEAEAKLGKEIQDFQEWVDFIKRKK